MDINEMLIFKAGEMRDKMRCSQQKLIEKRVNGLADDGNIEIFMNGFYEVINVKISQNIFLKNNVIIEQLIAKAVNDAVRKVKKILKDEMFDLTKDL